MQLAIEHDFLTTREAAKLLGYTHDYIARMCREQELAAVRTGAQWAIDRADLLNFAKRHAVRLEGTRARLVSERRMERARAAAPVPAPVRASVPSGRANHIAIIMAREAVAFTVAVMVSATAATVAASGAPHILGAALSHTASAAADGLGVLVTQHFALMEQSAATIEVHAPDSTTSFEQIFAIPSVAAIANDAPFVFEMSKQYPTHFVQSEAAFSVSGNAARPSIGETASQLGLFIGMSVRDAFAAFPEAALSGMARLGKAAVMMSESVLEVHYRAAYALAQASEPLARHTLAFLYRTGAGAEYAASRTPILAVSAFQEGTTTLAALIPRAVTAAAKAQIAFGTSLAAVSNGASHAAYSGLADAMELAESLPSRINDRTPVHEVYAAANGLSEALVAVERQRAELAASLNSQSSRVRSTAAYALSVPAREEVAETLRASVRTAGDAAAAVLKSLAD